MSVCHRISSLEGDSKGEKRIRPEGESGKKGSSSSDWKDSNDMTLPDPAPPGVDATQWSIALGLGEGQWSIENHPDGIKVSSTSLGRGVADVAASSNNALKKRKRSPVAQRNFDYESDSEGSHQSSIDSDMAQMPSPTTPVRKRRLARDRASKTSQEGCSSAAEKKLCKAEGCPKWRQSKYKGYCAKCYRVQEAIEPLPRKRCKPEPAQKPGDEPDSDGSSPQSINSAAARMASPTTPVEKRRVARRPFSEPAKGPFCRTEGCTKYRASKREGYCVRCFDAHHPDHPTVVAKRRKREESAKRRAGASAPKGPETGQTRGWQKGPTFEEREGQCRAFLEEHGHLNVPLPTDGGKKKKGTSGGNGQDEDEAQEDSEEKNGFRRWAQEMRVEYRDLLDGNYAAINLKSENEGRGKGWKRKKSMGLVMYRLEMLEEIGFNFEMVAGGDQAGGDSGETAVEAALEEAGRKASAEAAEAKDSGEVTTKTGTAELGEVLNLAAPANLGAGEAPSTPAKKGPIPLSRNRVIFDMRLEQCREFKAEKGHMNIGTLKNSLHLSEWAARMRSLYNQRLEQGNSKKNSSRLTASQSEKLKELESLGFAFDGLFDLYLHKLAAFKAETGHTKVPPTHEDKALRRWMARCRTEHKKIESSDYLTFSRLRKLTSIGFDFSTRLPEIPFDERLSQLRAYREAHGKDPSSNHPELGNWVALQRKYYNQKVDGKPKHYLSDERERKLRDVGFSFEAGRRPDARALEAARSLPRRSWDDYLLEFVRWKGANGHPFVPTVCEGEDKQLGRWVAAQRMKYRAFKAGKPHPKYGIMSAERVLMLTNAGFAFDASNIRRTPIFDSYAGAEMPEEYRFSQGEGDVRAMLPEWEPTTNSA